MPKTKATNKNPKFRKKHLGQYFIIAAFMIAGAVGLLNAAKAETVSDISLVGEINNFELNRSTGVPYETSGLDYRYETAFDRMKINGKINDMSVIAPGDKVEIELSSSAGSTYAPFATLSALDNELKDDAGVVQFEVSHPGISSPWKIVLTKTAANGGSGEFDFEINAAGVFVHMNPANWQSRNSDFTLGGITLHIPNPAKSSLKCNLNNRLQIERGAGNEYAVFGMRATFCDLYFDLLSGMSEAALRAKYGALLTDEFITVTTVAPHTPQDQAIGITLTSMLYFDYDLMDDGSALNMQYFRQKGYDRSIPESAAKIPVDSSRTAAINFMKGKTYQWSAVENSDKTWTVAINWGKLIGNDKTTYPAGNSVMDMPNTTAINTINQNLINRAYAMKLVAESIKNDVRIWVADKTVVNTFDLVMESNASVANNPTPSTPVVTVPVANSAVDQTTIKVHHVDQNGNNLPLSEAAVEVYNGWPAGTANPSPDRNVAPKNFNGYHLVTNRADLDKVANIVGVDPSRVLATSATWAYPATGTTDLYYVYRENVPCRWNPNLNDDDPNCFEPCQFDPSLPAGDPNCHEPDKPVEPNSPIEPENPDNPNPDEPDKVGAPDSGLAIMSNGAVVAGVIAVGIAAIAGVMTLRRKPL